MTDIEKTDVVSRDDVYRLVDDIIDDLCGDSLDLDALQSWGREQVMKLPSVITLKFDVKPYGDNRWKNVKEKMCEAFSSGLFGAE